MNNAAMLGKINNNFKKTLNEQMRDNRFMPAEIITQNGTTYTFGHSGYYKIFLIGHGGKANYKSSADSYAGSSGGVSVFTRHFSKNEQYVLTIGGTVKFGDLAPRAVKAYDSTRSAEGTPGTASGGDFNYNGIRGVRIESGDSTLHRGADLGIFIAELSRSVQAARSKDGNAYVSESGFGLVGYGAGEGLCYGIQSGIKEESAIIIIPLELED